MGNRSSLVRSEQWPVKDVSRSGGRKRGGMKGGTGQKGNAAVLFAVRATAPGFKLNARVLENRKIEEANDRGDFPLFGTTV